MSESQQVLEWMAEGEAKGQLQTFRAVLRDLLKDRFGPLPEALVQQIEATTDLEHLRAAVRQVSHLRQLDDLHL